MFIFFSVCKSSRQWFFYPFQCLFPSPRMVCSWFLFSSGCFILYSKAVLTGLFQTCTVNSFIPMFLFVYLFKCIFVCGCVWWGFQFLVGGDRPKELVLSSGYFSFSEIFIYIYIYICLIIFYYNKFFFSLHSLINLFSCYVCLWYFVWVWQNLYSRAPKLQWDFLWSERAEENFVKICFFCDT